MPDAIYLTQYLATHACQGFRPGLRYFAAGDTIECFLKDVRPVAQQVDAFLTLYVDPAHDAIIGWKINGALELLEGKR